MQNNLEFEDMRQQLNTLKKKLDQQEILNDNIIRRSMKNTVGSINRRYYFLMAIAVLMVPYGYWCFVKLTGFSVAFWIGTSVFMLVCAAATLYNSLRISSPNLMSQSLVSTRKTMARAKKFDSDWLLIGIPMIIVWLAWFAYESYLVEGKDGLIHLGVAALIGGFLGLVIGLKLHFKTQSQYQEIIDQIEELTK